MHQLQVALGMDHFYDSFALVSQISVRREAQHLFGLREDELLPDLRLTRDGVLRIGLGAHREHRVNHVARTTDRTKVSADVVQLAAHEVDTPEQAVSEGDASDSEGSDSAKEMMIQRKRVSCGGIQKSIGLPIPLRPHQVTRTFRAIQSISMQLCQDMWLLRQGTCSRTFYTTCDFFRRHATKNMGSVTLKWDAKSGPHFGVRRIVFSFRGPENGVQILGPILRSTLPVVFSQRDAEKGHPRVGCL